ncbi:MAG: hypothetical protein A2Y58_03805 [Chloroflexi bacterium RBG_13_51_52]|nr:MAG: hypothetical protein A2Y58_03805 [Chloroflexi bacterium RBG_13_51_52]
MKVRWPVIVILILTLILALASGSTILWRFFIFLVALLFMSYLWMRMNARHIDGRVTKLSPYSRVGERFEVEFNFVNNGRLPTALIEVQEENDFPGYQNTINFHLPAQGSYDWRSEGICRRRGIYDMGNFVVKITDPLGFFSVKEHIANSKSFIVFPTTIDLPFFQALPRQEPGLSKRRWFTSESGTNAARVRDYINGDNFRNIHWHTTAHTGNLMVKEFDPDFVNYAYKDIWIVMDMHSTSHCGKGNETTEEYAVTIAASLAKKYIDNGKKVGLMASGDRSFLFLPETGDEHREELLRALAMIDATSRLSLDALLASQEERFEPGAAIVVITPSADVLAPLRRIVNRGTMVTAILLDAVSFGGKVNASETARGLTASGIHVYIVRQGAEMVRALDSRFILSPLIYTGVKR